jgi:hypothetical protein
MRTLLVPSLLHLQGKREREREREREEREERDRELFIGY